MNKRIKSIAKVLLLIMVITSMAAILVFRPRVTIERETSLGGSDDDTINLLTYDGTLEEIQKSVEMSGNTVDEISYTGGSLLYWAAVDQRLDVAEWLLTDKGANPNGIHPARTPLSAAISKDDVAMTKLLIKFGADPELDTGNGITPRKLAEVDKVPEIIAALFAGESPSETSEYEEKTPP